MFSTELKSIERIALSVFSCLENELSSLPNSCHARFPKECCHVASSLLYQTLIEEGYTNFYLIRGTNLEGLHHVWIEINDYIIDLTAHQIDGVKAPLILVKKGDYPFNKVPYYVDIDVLAIEPEWEYFNLIYPEFLKIFYSKYFIRI